MTDINSILVDGQDVNMPALRAYLDALAQQVVTVGRRAYMPRWSAALAAHRLGQSRAKIACIGDSNTRGVGSNPSSATADLLRRSWPTVMAQELSKMPNTKAVSDSVWCDGYFGLTGSGNLGVADPRVTWETGWQSHPSLFVAGGKALHYPAAQSGTGRINFDFTVGNADLETDTVDVYFVKFPGYGDILLTTNNAAEFIASTNTNGASGVGKLTGTRSSFKDMEWTIQRSSSTPDVDLIIYGVETYTAADNPISVWNMGASGSKVADWVADNQPYSFINAIQVLAPDLSIICLTTNDAAANTNGVTYRANLQTIVDKCLISGDVLLMIGIPSNVETATEEEQAAFAAIVRELAAENDLPLIDLQARWISQSAFPLRGLYFDGVHASQKGHFDVGYTAAQIVGNPGVYLG